MSLSQLVRNDRMSVHAWLLEFTAVKLVKPDSVGSLKSTMCWDCYAEARVLWISILLLGHLEEPAEGSRTLRDKMLEVHVLQEHLHSNFGFCLIEGPMLWRRFSHSVRR